MSELIWHAAAVFFGLFAFMDFLVLVWLAIHSRRWEGAHQAALLDETRKTVDMVRSNVGRIHHEHIEERHETVESLERLWSELKTINARLDAMKCPLSEPNCPLKLVIAKEDDSVPR